MRAVGQFQESVSALVGGGEAGGGVYDFTSGADGVQEKLGRGQSVRNRQFDATHDLTEWMDFRTSLLQTFLRGREEGGKGGKGYF